MNTTTFSQILNLTFPAMPMPLFESFSMSFNLLFFHYKSNELATSSLPSVSTSRHDLFMILFKHILSHFSGYDYYYMVWITYMYSLHNKEPIPSIFQTVHRPMAISYLKTMKPSPSRATATEQPIPWKISKRLRRTRRFLHRRHPYSRVRHRSHKLRKSLHQLHRQANQRNLLLRHHHPRHKASAQVPVLSVRPAQPALFDGTRGENSEEVLRLSRR